jgi:hypothetical protein
MYYSDLTLYRYIERESATDVLNIGWLDIAHPFPKKKASQELLDALFEKCLRAVNQTRGFHQCQFCSVPTFGTEVSRNDKTIRLGSAEIRVEAQDGKVYAAPNLIYHYVLEHDYDPPQEFLEALLR